METSGHCLCGAVRFAFDAAPLWQAHCHCDSCRRQTASPMTTFLGLRDGTWRWTGAAPAVYASSPGVARWFCPVCGSPIAYKSDRFPDETHFYACLLEDPRQVTPQEHVHWDARLPWLHLADDLPKRGGAG